MKKTISIFIAGFLFFSLYSQEKQMPFDQKGNIYIFTRELNKSTNLYDYPDFHEARIYRVSDSTFSLEIVTFSQNQYLRTKKIIDLNEYNLIKGQVDARLAPGEKTSAEKKENINEGRAKFIIANTAVGLAFYGTTIPKAFDIQDNRFEVGIYMLTGGLSFYLPFALTSKNDISYAEAGAWIYGQTRGAAHGICLPYLFNDTAPNESAIAALAVIGSITEAFSFYSIAKHYHFTSGQVHAIGCYADFGLMEGFLLAQCFGNYEGLIHKSTYAGMLTGSAIGYATGYFLSRNDRYTPGDAYVTYTTGLLGTYLAGVGNILADNRNQKGVYSTLAIGTILGVAGGQLLSGYNDYTPVQGMLTGVGTAAGGLFGHGLGYLISENNEKVWFSTSAVCAVAGFAAMNYIFRDSSRKKSGAVPQISFMPALYPKGGSGIGYAPSVSLSMRF